jgi:L-ascorbate metabolism protein UlaG (beta-lactamase superfamily)
MGSRSWAEKLLASAPPAHGVELTWLGQSSFVVRAAGTALLVDPFLTPRDDRVVPPPDRPEAFAGVDAVLVTHEHYDHLDPDACRDLASASPETRFAAPRPITNQLTDLGVGPDRIDAMQPGDRIDVGAAAVSAVPACHAVHVSDGYSLGRELSGGDVRFLGYVVEIGGVRIYHAGDTIDFDGLADELRRVGVEIALLPINGRLPEREAQDIAGNLGPEEAVELAVAAGARAATPMHYDMFAANLGDVGRFARHATTSHPDLALVVPGRERPLTLV